MVMGLTEVPQALSVDTQRLIARNVQLERALREIAGIITGEVPDLAVARGRLNLIRSVVQEIPPTQTHNSK